MLKKTTLTILTVFLVVLLGGVSIAQAKGKTSCDSRFKNSEDKQACRASSGKDASACDGIGDSSKRNFCLAQVTNDPKYCEAIDNALRKKQCQSMTSGKDTVASHRK